MSAIQPISSAAMSSLIWEIDPDGAEALFGPSPLESGGSGGSPLTGRIARVLALLRDSVIPRVWRSANTSEVTIVRRYDSALADDPLGVRYITTTEDLYAVISGPTVESMESGLLEVSDYEVLIPQSTLGTQLSTSDAIQIDGIECDIVGIRAHPKIPIPVAYRYLCKRAA